LCDRTTDDSHQLTVMKSSVVHSDAEGKDDCKDVEYVENYMDSDSDAFEVLLVKAHILNCTC